MLYNPQNSPPLQILEVLGQVHLAEKPTLPTCTGQLPQRDRGGESGETRGRKRPETGGGRRQKWSLWSDDWTGTCQRNWARAEVLYLQPPLLAEKCPLSLRSPSTTGKPFSVLPVLASLSYDPAGLQVDLKTGHLEEYLREET